LVYSDVYARKTKILNIRRFIEFVIVWIGDKLSLPVWIVGHVHLEVEKLDHVASSKALILNCILLIAFYLEYKKSLKETKE
jgi:hypothetical protein